MLTKHDIAMMENDVCDIISSWHSSCTIVIPKPIEQQTHWNPIMNEYTGDIDYDTLTNVPCERKDIVNISPIDIKHSIAGDRDDGDLLYALPLYYMDDNGNSLRLNITDECIFKIDEHDEWTVKSIKHRIGETLVSICKLSGGTSSGLRR